MSKKKKEKKEIAALDPMEEIKNMELKKREKVVEKVEEKVCFDVWWSLRHKMIPKMHKKEVILANFKAWGLGKFEKVVDFDAALRKYGIKF